MEISNEKLRTALLSLVAFVAAVTVHEFGHAFVADRLGDRLPRSQGRLTLSPRAHIDLVGTIIVPLLAALATMPLLIAWGKPVYTNPEAMTRRIPRTVANLLVSVAGPLMNLLMAAVTSVGLLVAARTGYLSPGVAKTVIHFVVVLNISLLFFNLLPIPPLDGRSLLPFMLPRSAHGVLPVLDRYGVLFLIALVMLGVGRVVMIPALAWGNALRGALGFGSA
jgi:Zn-dependent protease